MQRTQFVMAFLLGAVVALGAALVVTASHGALPAAYAQTAGNNELLMVATTDTTNQNNNIFVIDSKSARLAAYKFNNNKLALMSVRQFTYDMKLVEYPRGASGGPSVSEIQQAAQASEAAGKGGK